MRIYNKMITLLIMMYCSTTLCAEQYIYISGLTTYKIKETQKDYEVICIRNNIPSDFWSKSSVERSMRLDAIDLIGTYIVYKDYYYTKIKPDYFQLFVDCIDLHFKSTIQDVRQDYRKLDGKNVVCYTCSKDNFKMESVTYRRNLDLLTLLELNYSKRKNEKSASLLYESSEFEASHYIQLEEDFHRGNVVLSSELKQLVQIEDRLERSIYAENEKQLITLFQRASDKSPNSEPYCRFYLQELVTSAPLSKKKKYYQEWQESMQMARTVWEDALYYCSQEIEQDINTEVVCFTDVISSFVGAISPFGIRQPINKTSYNKAVKAYAKSDFQQSVDILIESIDTEGISSESLNLLGASFRFLNEPHKALPFLILGFKLNPKTHYLVGNIALCLKMIDYPQMDEVCNFLMNYVVDEWSKNEIKNIQIQ